MEELHQYLLEGEGSWALSENFLIFVGRILRDPNIKPDTRVHLLRTLAIAALKDDVILLLHQDRREHTLMNYAQDIDRHSLEEQQALALFVRLKNCFPIVYCCINNRNNNNDVFFRCVIYLKILAHQNGYCTYLSGHIIILKYQIFV